MIALVISGLIICCATMLCAWLWQRRTYNANIADVAWPLGFALTITFYYSQLGPDARYGWLGLVLGLGWSLRLGLCMALRDHLLSEEDGRFAAMRSRWGENQHRNFLVFNLLQGLAAGVMASALLPLMAHESAIRLLWLEVFLALALLALVLETVADVQLLRHRLEPAQAGLTCRRGLWSRCRHPNYFFEGVFWLSIIGLGIASCFAWTGNGGWQGEYLWLDASGLWTLPGALLILLACAFQSGIPATEAHCVSSRRDYAAYQRDVPVLFPRLLSRDNTASRADNTGVA